MKRKLLFILGSVFTGIFISGQFTSGTVSLGATGMTVKMDTNPTTVTLTLTGPSNSFMGIGGGDLGMADGADGFIYNSSASRDYTFNGVGVTPSADASQDWTVTSNVVAAGTRTVVATRSLNGGAEDTPIPNTAGPLDIFYAKGDNTLTLSYHGAGNRGYATLNMTAALATGEENLAGRIQFYPNPSTGMVYFKNSGKIKNLSIFDSTGRLMKTPELKNDAIDLTRLKAGVYYIETESKDGTKTQEKLIKN
ncbi:MAG: T9SS type A sorting domain-containing protein [Weeksellaceae bacterium]|nr:T9SS type A sorting domain-containing protein [Bacteroidota bacterium]MCG2781629.1 T9SS type A sorting domain-containing protein [Weeksellaceae bacterium]